MSSLVHMPALTVAVIALAASTAHASPIHYDESISGDLDFGVSLELDLGNNTVVGTLPFPSGAEVSDLDVFEFVVPTGALLSSIDFAFVTAGTATAASALLDIVDTTPPEHPVVGQVIDLLGPSPVHIETDLPPDSYVFGFFMAKVPDDAEASIDYTITMTVEPDPASVPEPGTLSLLALGLAATARLRRRHAR
jgi:hypothetical protein